MSDTLIAAEEVVGGGGGEVGKSDLALRFAEFIRLMCDPAPFFFVFFFDYHLPLMNEPQPH